jgi:hypothetical protein
MGDFVASHVRAVAYFGGATRIVVPDHQAFPATVRTKTAETLMHVLTNTGLVRVTDIAYAVEGARGLGNGFPVVPET